jgi:hypothetical protein
MVIWPDSYCKSSGGTRCNVRWHVLAWIAFLLLSMSVAAEQQPQTGVARSNSGPVTQITINGKQITGEDVMVRKGITYVSVPAMARALGASISSKGQGNRAQRFRPD